MTVQGGTQLHLPVSLGKLVFGWLWAASKWDASWMGLENFEIFGIFLDLNVIGVIGTLSGLGGNYLLFKLAQVY